MTKAPRMFTSEVCELARYTPGTLSKKIKEGKMPKPIDRGREMIFCRQAVERALGLQDDEPVQEQGKFDVNLFKRLEKAGAHDGCS